MVELSQSGDLFSVFFRTCPDYCSISTLDEGVMLEVNDAFVRTTGWSREEVIGRSVYDFGLWPNPDDRRQLVARVRAEGHIQVDRVVLATRAGGLIECTATMFPYTLQGRECLIATIRDVSGQRRAEGALARLARAAGLNTRDFFERMVVDLARSLDAEYCLIGTLSGESGDALDQIAIVGSEMKKPYRFIFGPGLDVLHEPVVVIPAGVRERYPQDKFVSRNRVESFAGASLRDRQQQVIGMMLVMSTRPFAHPETVGHLLQAFADRAAAEMVMERERLVFVGAQSRLMAEIEATRDNFEMQAKKLQSMLDASPLTVGIVVDRKWTVLNRAFEKMFGYRVDEIVGRSLEIIYPSHEDFLHVGERVQAAIVNGGVSHVEVQYRRKNGEIFWANNYTRLIDEAAPEKGAVVILEDISERKAAEARIRFLAEHDHLTGLPNRFVLRDRFELERRHAVRNGRRLSLLFLDLDHFKQVNDVHGHAVGDALLKAVVQRVQASIREIDSLCRQGGDEFVALLPSVQSDNEVEAIVQRIATAMQLPFRLGEIELGISFSIGIAVYPDDAADFQTLLQRADIAMYRAKQAGRNQHRFYGAAREASPSRS